MASRIPSVPFQLVIRNDDLGAEVDVVLAPYLLVVAVVGDLAGGNALGYVDVIAPVGISFAAATYRWVVRLFERSVPRVIVRFGVIVGLRAPHRPEQHSNSKPNHDSENHVAQIFL